MDALRGAIPLHRLSGMTIRVHAPVKQTANTIACSLKALQSPPILPSNHKTANPCTETGT